VDAAASLAWLIPQIQPYLKIKRPQADAILEFLRNRSQLGTKTALTDRDVDLLFVARLANQKSYNKGAFEHILYKGTPYTRQSFRELLLSNRNGSLYRVIEWTPQMDARVGTNIDRVVASQLGLKLAQVQRRREQLHRPPFGSLQAHWSKVLSLRAEGLTLRAIAKMVGISRSSVQRILDRDAGPKNTWELLDDG
jgi:DNA-directed RNA polymerase specialized sigma subunit